MRIQMITKKLENVNSEEIVFETLDTAGDADEE